MHEKSLIICICICVYKGNYFRFGSFFIKKKITKSKLKKKLKPVQTDWFRFGLVFWKKIDLTRFFSGFAQFFSGLGSIRFF
jgi:hypothetical protein